MGCVKGAPEKEVMRFRYRGISVFCNKSGTQMVLKGTDGKRIYSERTEEQPASEQVKVIIDQIKDGQGWWKSAEI